MSSGTSEEPTVTIWGDQLKRSVNARMVSDLDASRQAELTLDVVDYNDDQDPTVVLGVVSDGSHALFMTAYDAERLGVFLIQAAAFSRQIEPGGRDPLVQHQARP